MMHPVRPFLFCPSFLIDRPILLPSFMNHRFALRLVTNLTVWILTLSCVGIVLWVIDEFLGWDILPDALSLLTRALLVAGGIIALVLVVMNVVLSLALLAESNASRAELPDYNVSKRFTRRVGRTILVGILAIALLLGGLQAVNQLRRQTLVRAERVEFNQVQDDMDTTIEQVLTQFSEPILEGIATGTLAEKGQLGNLQKLFQSIESSFPHAPRATLLVLAKQAPYKYAQIGSSSIAPEIEGGRIVLTPKLFTGFPSEAETQAIEALFSKELPDIPDALAGNFIRNTIPSSWGVLERDGKAIAIVHVEATGADQFYPPSFYHDGPQTLFTNAP